MGVYNSSVRQVSISNTAEAEIHNGRPAAESARRLSTLVTTAGPVKGAWVQIPPPGVASSLQKFRKEPPMTKKHDKKMARKKMV